MSGACCPSASSSVCAAVRVMVRVRLGYSYSYHSNIFHILSYIHATPPQHIYPRYSCPLWQIARGPPASRLWVWNERLHPASDVTVGMVVMWVACYLLLLTVQQVNMGDGGDVSHTLLQPHPNPNPNSMSKDVTESHPGLAHRNKSRWTTWRSMSVRALL
jgi:hypothetical protein